MKINDIKFMREACWSCDDSPCEIKTGCVLVKDGEVILKSCNTLPSSDKNTNLPEREYAIHSEENLVNLAKKGGISLEYTILYLTRYPCDSCAKLLIATGLKSIYYMSDNFTLGNTAKPLLENAKVKIAQITEKQVWENYDR